LVDQWDWEKVITKEERSIETLIQHATAVFNTLKSVEKIIAIRRGEFPTLPVAPKVIHAEELLQRYPKISSKDREHAASKENGAIILIGIGGLLSNGETHDLRAPDYDDWSTPNTAGFAGLNADLIVWDTTRNLSLEISSMGIRVDEKALHRQLAEHGATDRIERPFHKALINGDLPYTIGGGIGQSRVAMFVNKKSNIIDVQPVYK
jgi:aspartate--ammonia ligase